MGTADTQESLKGRINVAFRRRLRTIGKRPSEIGNRSSFGHWEGDLMIFRLEYGKANLTSLVERRSRFTILARIPVGIPPAS